MKHFRYLLIAVPLMLDVQTVSADTIFQGSTVDATPNAYNAIDWTFSDTFIINTNSVIDSLGYYDYGGNNTSSHIVGLYNASGTLLFSETIQARQNYSQNYDWLAFAPIALIAGQTYTIAGQSNSDPWGYNGTVTSSTLFTNVSSQWDRNGTLNLPTSSSPTFNSGLLINGPNADIQAQTAVPEPTSIALLASSFIGFIASRRKNNQTRNPYSL